MRNKLPVYGLLLFGFLSGFVWADEKWPMFNLQKADPQQLPQAKTIKVNHDPVYKTAKEYQAYPLAEILKKMSPSASIKKDDLVLVFTAVDGYKVSMAYQDAMRERGYIAFKDTAAPGEKRWLDFKFGKQTMTPAPYYLVWPKQGLDEWRYPWPFQLAALSLQPARVYFGAAAPSGGDEQVHQGFSLFSRYCIRCHSINLSGGEVGPELNAPKNITDYFKEEALAPFILNATKYRAGTKMPVFENLISADDAEAIVSYLKQMKIEPKH